MLIFVLNNMEIDAIGKTEVRGNKIVNNVSIPFTSQIVESKKGKYFLLDNRRYYLNKFTIK